MCVLVEAVEEQDDTESNGGEEDKGDGKEGRHVLLFIPELTF